MMKAQSKILVFGVCLFFALNGFPVQAQEKKTDSGPMVRIAILRDADRVQLQLNGAYEISDPISRTVLEKGMRYSTSEMVTPGDTGLNLGEKPLGVKRVRFYARRDVSVFFKEKEKRYRGYIDILLMPDKKLTVINQLELEDYIRGVLYHEVSNRWPMEALKAQAVAARSYAVYQMKANVSRDYDVTNDIYSQVYGGRTGERYRTNIAVLETAGEVLVYQGKILPSYFFATCGGRTENAKELWPRHEMPPLKGVACIYCRESPHYFWKKNLQLKDIQEKLIAKGQKIGLIQDIAILSRNASDRIEKVQITDRTGKQITMLGKDFREAVGPNIIRSNNYYVVMHGYYVDFFGKGWGHGVGMCQWGAQGMSSLGFNYEQILQFYYPGTEIATIKNAAPRP